MIDYDPRRWKNTAFKRGYIYVMMYDEIRTVNALAHINGRVIDRRFYTNMARRGDKWYWGWVAFEEPLNLMDAMDAGLVPIFRDGRHNDTEETERNHQGSIHFEGNHR